MSLLLLFEGGVRSVRSFVDNAGSADRLARTLRLGAFVDDAGSSDTAEVSRTLRPGPFTDDAGSADALSLVAERRLSFVDNAGSSDTAERVMDIRRAFLDDAGAGDTLVMRRTMYRSFLDDAGATDTALIDGRPPFPNAFDGWLSADLGSDQITVQNAPLIAGGRYGDEERDWSSAQSELVDRCSVQPFTAAEVTADREFTSTRLRLFCPPATDITANSRVLFAGTAYEVDGEPGHWRDLDGRPSHIEAVLVRMSG